MKKKVLDKEAFCIKIRIPFQRGIKYCENN